MRPLVVVLGLLAAAPIVGRLVLGRLILGGRADLAKAHQHSGYTAVAVSLVYIGLSSPRIVAGPKAGRGSTAEGAEERRGESANS